MSAKAEAVRQTRSAVEFAIDGRPADSRLVDWVEAWLEDSNIEIDWETVRLVYLEALVRGDITTVDLIGDWNVFGTGRMWLG